ncbi:unnamed protein product, partial [Gongylonema pulchrum]|uniref:KH_dom_type_1 domain-containing protein n=1 Tax=Gongylonema pulchrum TaxID=637853 RepID=A0A183DET9_9BILA
MDDTMGSADANQPPYSEGQEGRCPDSSSANTLSEEHVNPEEAVGNNRYFEDLIQEMHDLDAYRFSNPGKLQIVYGMLVNEINSIWGHIYARANRCEYTRDMEHGQEVMEGRRIIMHERVPIPDRPNSKYIGRILGPRGLTVRQLEAQTDCRILIRGKGSVKDPRREAWLRNRIGWEHLSEPLHVLITATDFSEMRCA